MCLIYLNFALGVVTVTDESIQAYIIYIAFICNTITHSHRRLNYCVCFGKPSWPGRSVESRCRSFWPIWFNISNIVVQKCSPFAHFSYGFTRKNLQHLFVQKKKIFLERACPNVWRCLVQEEQDVQEYFQIKLVEFCAKFQVAKACPFKNS